jgi:hypothetical protein
VTNRQRSRLSGFFSIKSSVEPCFSACSHLLRSRASAYAFAVGIIILLSFYYRLPGLNPASLCLDDLWVGVLVKSASLSFVFGEHYPLSPGFLLILKAVAWLLGDGSWQLQLIPLLSSFALIVLIAWSAYRITGVPGLGLFSAMLLAGNHILCLYSLRVKQPAIDSLATLAILSLAARCLKRRSQSSFVWLLVISTVSAFISFAAIIPGVLFVNLIGYFLLRLNSREAQRRKSIVFCAVCYNAFIAMEWFCLLRSRMDPSLVNSFEEFYLPLGNFRAAMGFLCNQGFAFFADALPDKLSGFSIFIPVGLYYLVRRTDTRLWGLGVLALYVCAFAASAFRIYPLGSGRTDAFSYPATILLISAAVWALCQKLPAAWIICTAALLFILIYEFPRSRIGYPDFGDKAVVEETQKLIHPKDGLIVYPFFNWSIGYYSRWPHSLVKVQDSSIGFYVKLDRERSIVLHESYKGAYFISDRSVITEQLRPFLNNSLKRIFYIGTTGEWNSNQWIIQTIESQGFTLEEKHCNGNIKVFNRQSRIPETILGSSGGMSQNH